MERSNLCDRGSGMGFPGRYGKNHNDSQCVGLSLDIDIYIVEYISTINMYQFVIDCDI